MKLFARHFGLHTHEKPLLLAAGRIVQSGGKKSFRLVASVLVDKTMLLLAGLTTTKACGFYFSELARSIHRVILIAYTIKPFLSLPRVCVCVCMSKTHRTLLGDVCHIQQRRKFPFVCFTFVSLCHSDWTLQLWLRIYLNGRCLALLLFDPSKGK
jgi:hypothetical protein